MNLERISQHRLFRPALAAGVASLCGLLLLTKVGDGWTNASYDYLFRFGTRPVTNKVVLILMDNTAYAELHQSREPGAKWDRNWHAKLLSKLAKEGCPMVVLDVFFGGQGTNEEADAKLATALRELKCAVLMAKKADAGSGPEADAVNPVRPWDVFLAAAKTNWGSAYFDDHDIIVRKHWPFPSPRTVPSLPWTAARLAGANLSDIPEERWLRYYAPHAAWGELSYNVALERTNNYFRDKIVFIGNKPENEKPNNEDDKFCTPYTGRTEAVGGIELHATAFLNLVNGEWLKRPSWALETALFILFGTGSGAGLSALSKRWLWISAAAVAFATALGGVVLSYYTNYWFPWLIAAGAQVPCALAVAVLIPRKAIAKLKSVPKETIVLQFPDQNLPDAPEYELFDPPFGEGGFGKVWLVKNAIGQWQALKAVYQSKFGDNPGPYDAEFNGLQKYKPVSEKHPGLLRIDLISRKKAEGYFYYVMELGDAIQPGWEKDPSTYKPRDLERARKQAPGGKLPVRECVRLGVTLSEALDFLHRQGLTHRDIKPSNVIFANGQPKLADVGLVTDIRPPELVRTWVGTAGYMPPPPEKPGTVQADIFALGMLLYVISTGSDPDFFPGLSTTLIANSGHADFVQLNAIIIKACQPDTALRYQTTAEMLHSLREAQKRLGEE